MSSLAKLTSRRLMVFGTGAATGAIILYATLMGVRYFVNDAIQWRFLGDTLIRKAAIGDVDAIRHIVAEEPRALHASDGGGRTALHHASQNGRVDAARVLMSMGAIVDAKDKYGYTPLFLALEKGRIAVAEALLSAGANPIVIDQFGLSIEDFRDRLPTKVFDGKEDADVNPMDFHDHDNAVECPRQDDNHE
jgi:ankyrin repeat protein